MKHSPRYVVLYDGYCLLCDRAKRFIELFDWFHMINVVNLYDTDAMKARDIHVAEPQKLLEEVHLIEHGGRTYTGFYACRKIGLLLPVTFFFTLFLYIPGMSIIGIWVYKYISTHRR